MEHSDSYNLKPPAGPAGENLAAGSFADMRSVVGLWYDELKDCDALPGCTKSKTSQSVGHFTALVWKGATKLGCAHAGRFYVCRYKAGDTKSCDTPNMSSCYKSNVLAASKTVAQCGGAPSASASPTASPSGGASPPGPATPTGGEAYLCGGATKFVKECDNCYQSSQCEGGGYCCPFMKKCVKSGATSCYGPIAHCMRSGCQNKDFPSKWVVCPPRSGSNAPSAAPSPAVTPGAPKFTEDEELERELAERLESPSTIVLVRVGGSASASKTVDLPSSVSPPASSVATLALQVLDQHEIDCPMVVNKHNWDGGHTSSEEFRIKLLHGKLEATRIDQSGKGWALDLAFKCTTKTKGKDQPTKDAKEVKKQLKKDAEEACERIKSGLAEQAKKFGRLFGSEEGVELRKKMEKRVADAKEALEEAVKNGDAGADALQKAMSSISALRKEQHAAKWKLAGRRVRDLVSNATLAAQEVLGQVEDLVKDNLVKRFDLKFEKLSKEDFESKKLAMIEKIAKALNVSTELITLLFIGGPSSLTPSTTPRAAPPATAPSPAASDLCSSGYALKLGDKPGWGDADAGGLHENVPSANACAALCDRNGACRSFEWSPTEKKCALNSVGDPPQPAKHKDYLYCVKPAPVHATQELVQLAEDAGAGSVAVLVAGDAESPLDALDSNSGAMLAEALGASQESTSESGLSTIALVGIVLGGLFGVTSLLVLIGISRRRAHKRARNKQLLDEHLVAKAKAKQTLGVC